MPTSCGAKSCLSIFLSYDRGSPTLPVVRACLAKADPTEAAFKQATPGRGSALRLPRKPDLISSCCSLIGKAPEASSGPCRQLRAALSYAASIGVQGLWLWRRSAQRLKATIEFPSPPPAEIPL